MNIQEIYELGLAQGWDPDDARMLAAIACRKVRAIPIVSMMSLTVQ